MPDRNTLNREQAIDLCAMLEEVDELFRNLEQIAILKKEVDHLKSDQFKNR